MKPIILTGTWNINAPLHRIYEIVTDFENAPKYFPLVATSLKIINTKGNFFNYRCSIKNVWDTFSRTDGNSIIAE